MDGKKSEEILISNQHKIHLKILEDIHSSNSWTSFQAKTKIKPQKGVLKHNPVRATTLLAL